VLANTLAILAAHALSSLFLVWAAIKQARHLREREWGLYGYFVSSMEVFRTFTNFGLDVVGIRLIAIGHRPAGQLVRHLIIIKSLLATFSMFLIILLCPFISRWAEAPLLILSLGTGLFPLACREGLIVRFQAEHRMERLIPVELANGMMYLLGIYLACWAGSGVGGFIGVKVGYDFFAMALTLLMARWTWRSSPEERIGTDWSVVRSIFRQGLPVGILALMIVVYSRMGVFLLEHFGTLENVGQFYIALRVSEPLLTIAGALSTSAYPVLSRLAEQRNIEELKRRFALYSVRSALLSCIVAALLTLFAEELLRLIKPEYVTAKASLVVLSWASVFMFQNQLSTAMINGFGKYHYVTIFGAMNLCTYAAFSWILIPRRKTLGAALATFGTEGINALVQIVAVSLMLRGSMRSKRKHAESDSTEQEIEAKMNNER
jgi:O-antigen/teichoic acid export membrane protein